MRTLLLLPFLLLAACNSTLNSKLDASVAPVQASLELKGPITLQLQMQGPTVKYEGTYISKEIMAQVEVKHTRGDWVLAVFGEPDSRAALADNSEIWKWSYRPVEQSPGVFAVFNGPKDEPKLLPVTAFVRVKDAIVIEKYRD